jgi:hypothetical protein
VGLHKFSDGIQRMLVRSDLVEVIVQYICLVLSCERIGRIGRMVDSRYGNHYESSIE